MTIGCPYRIQVEKKIQLKWALFIYFETSNRLILFLQYK